MKSSPETTPPLPRFSTPKGSNYSIAMKPPFSFSGVTNLVFPLRASLDSLQRFCDNYLNIIPAEIGRFRAPMPYVYLMLLDYGRMAIDVANVGWLSQREVFFCVPLEWYRVVDGQWIFQDWASICPFIYVDDTMSANVGRSVYGWPKSLAHMEPTLSDWMTDPLAPIIEATLSTMVFPELYAGDRLEERTFLQVERKRAPSTARLPFDPGNAFAPWSIASNLADTMAGFGRDVVGLLAGLGLAPMHLGSTGNNYLTMLSKLTESAFPLRPNVVANTLNLKQFRRSERPEEFCYQALTNGPMRYTSLNRTGLLGQERLLLGDITCGYSIKLHEWPSLPIVETLGLEVARKWPGHGANVVELDPVMPFWYDVNMSYEPGYNVAWRTRDSVWHDREGKTYPRGPKETGAGKLFNTTLGAGNKAVAGPFHFSGTTVRVLPLLAESKCLIEFVDGYLNAPLRDGDAGARFSLWTEPNLTVPPLSDGQPAPSEFSYVYLTATTFDDVTSGTDNIGDWADAEVAFLVPVKYEERDPNSSEWRLASVGLLPAFTYLDSVTAAAARAEVLGIPSTVATFGKPESAWMAEDGAEAGARQVLLSVEVEVLPAVGEGQKSQRRTILDIISGDIAEQNDPLEWRESADRWGAILKGELARKKAAGREPLNRGSSAKSYDASDVLRALSLEVLANRAPISLFSLKQIRDVADADLACYQSITRVHRTLSEVLDIQEVEHPMMVRVHEFPTQPIKSLLGLVAKEIDGDGLGITYAIQPIRPFWMRVTMDESLGGMLWYRSGGSSWAQPETPVRSYFDDRCAPRIGVGAVDHLDTEGEPRRLAKIAVEWTGGNDPSVSPELARRAVALLDPQTVLETLLSREWGNWSDTARWLVRREALIRRLEKKVAGLTGPQQMMVEHMLLREQPPRRGNLPDKVSDSARTEHLKPLIVAAGFRAMIDEAWTDLLQFALDHEAARGNHLSLPKESYGRFPGLVVQLLRGLELMAEMPNMKRYSAAAPAGQQSRPPGETRGLRAFLDGFKAIETLATLLAVPDGTPSQATEAQLTELAGLVWASHDDLQDAVSLARDHYALHRLAVLNAMSRDEQKPDHVVRRDAAGPEANRIFPLDDSWDETWYAGVPGNVSDAVSLDSSQV
jgi:hypothetical protein